MDRPADRANAAFLSLRSAIVEAALPPGTRLPEDLLAQQYGVSRTLIRGTLARLTAAGLVETGKAKSALVANPSLTDAKETFEVRRCLEREAVRRIAQGWQPSMGDVLGAHVARELTATTSPNPQVSGRLGAEFHILLAKLSGNALLERYLSEVIWRCALILAVHGRDHDQRGSVDEHQRLVDLMAARDADGAEVLIVQHVAAVEERTLAGVGRDGHLDLTAVLSRY
ncbi:GntR family transcriptional regulator [Cellulomonas sp. URHE0023]|uniref:GntR family transcriptional regulator n=1 Tax=Cellulomonas sp. URHE0023 TaxID=1380354 RepID=UPI000482AB61|nr:GntR family transcriptional regulator [Cellulomonas sp. URHE0023]